MVERENALVVELALLVDLEAEPLPGTHPATKSLTRRGHALPAAR
jgi:hypothetical protein